MARLEDFLGIDREEINRRKEEMRQSIPTTPGVGYLKAKAKKWDVQPWPFITYLACYAPNELERLLQNYSVYDGNENAQLIRSELQEYLITYSLIASLQAERHSIVPEREQIK